MKKWLIGSLFLSFLFSSCVSMMGSKYHYSYNLKDPNSNNLSFSDELIGVKFQITDTSIAFNMKNLTSDSIKIIWDEVSFVQNGNAQRVMHVGVKYTDRNNSQPPTVIPPEVSIDENIIPVNNVYWREGYYSQYSSSPGGWEERDILPTQDLDKEEYSATILGLKGQLISLYLPIESTIGKKNYKFVFEVTDVVKVTPSTY